MVRTPREVKMRLKMGDFFMRGILEKGDVLYARGPHQRVEVRYPGESTTPTETRHAVSDMKKVRAFVRVWLAVIWRKQRKP